MKNLLAHKEAFRLLTGPKLGQGIARKTYACRLNTKWVVKVETGTQDFQNIDEWHAWSSVEGTAHEKWFAPCHHISPCGLVLIMDRTESVPIGALPKRMPRFLGDFKQENYGLLRGKVVCHDYGRHRLREHGMTGGMRSVTWV